MTVTLLITTYDCEQQQLTFVHQLELGDDVQSNIREVVLQHLEKHGE